VQQVNKVAIFRRLAEGGEKPLRVIQGPDTGLADPHGIFIDAENNEIFVANHDSYHLAETSQEESTDVQGQLARGIATISVPQARLQPRASSGKFVEPAVTVFSRTAENNASPVRVIRGPKTELSLPMKVFVDTVHNEIFVANSGSNSILVFSRTANGDVSPLRKIEGPATKLKKPVGLFVDLKNDEVWATSPEEHSAIVFPNPLAEAILVYRGDASGDAAPIRTIQGPRTLLQENDELALDNVHDEIIVPTRQAILVFSRTANGNVAPLRIIAGPKTMMF